MCALHSERLNITSTVLYATTLLFLKDVCVCVCVCVCAYDMCHFLMLRENQLCVSEAARRPEEYLHRHKGCRGEYEPCGLWMTLYLHFIVGALHIYLLWIIK